MSRPTLAPNPELNSSPAVWRSTVHRLCAMPLLAVLTFGGCGGSDTPPPGTSPTPEISPPVDPTPTATPVQPTPTSPGSSPTIEPTRPPLVTPEPTDTPTAPPGPTDTPTAPPGPTDTSTPASPAPTATPTAPPLSPTATPTATPEPTPTLPPDADGDTFSPGEGDCDDLDPQSYPGAVETPYDGIDQDCDGEDLIDVDEDSFIGLDAGGNDCDDLNPNTYPGATEFGDGKDNDCNGLIDDSDTLDNDGDGFSESQGDCRDDLLEVYPGATEVPYNGLDDDCTGGDLTDSDGDLFEGGPDGDDCNDYNPDIHPGVDEVPYDGIDQDCSGQDLTDVDQDGFDAAVAAGSDCDDTAPAINPGAAEICDAIDNNCDDLVDIDAVDRIPVFTDADGDTFGDPLTQMLDCLPAAGQVTQADDCDDTRADVNPAAPEACDLADNNCNAQIDEGVQTTFYSDADGDGHGNASSPIQACSVPEGASPLSDDCDDSTSTTFTGAPESCNGVDDSCDGLIDEGVKLTWYLDLDQDGYGVTTSTTQACTQPAGYAALSGDCRDTNDLINPGESERCNSLDDNCNGQIDENVASTYYQDADGDGYGNPSVRVDNCNAPAGYVVNNTDCNDTNAAINPGKSEVCNGTDDNCNTQTDEGVKTTWYQDLDQDSYGNASVSTQSCSAPSGYVGDGTDCNDLNNTVYPNATETCDTLDNNCNGQKDEGAGITFYVDADNDGYGNPQNTVKACSLSTGLVSNNLDCDDTRSTVYPNAQEICDGIDQDCDGTPDDGVKLTWYQDVDMDGYGNAASTTQACTQPSGYVGNAEDCKDTNDSIKPGATEIANGIDDDCDGSIDEGVLYSSCRDIKKYIPTAASGVFRIDTDGTSGTNPAFDVYCDMSSDGGGWTLVLLNSSYVTPPKPSWSAVVSSVTITGTFGTNLQAFDLFMGVKYWNGLGAQLRIMQGASPTSISHKAFYNFALDEANNYALGLSAENVTVCSTGSCSSGLYTYHNGRPLTTFDRDNDAYGTNCANLYGNTAWWYGSCWSGSFWGGGDGGGYTNNPYWIGSSGEFFAWGSMWLR